MTAAADMREIQALRDEVRRVSRYDVRRPADTTSSRFLQIIQGQTLTSGQYGINYSASLSLSQLYDPDVDTTYPTGLGNAWLWVNGSRTTRVLMRHDASDYQTPLLAGRRCRVLSTVVLTVTSGADTGATMLAYRHTWE